MRFRILGPLEIRAGDGFEPVRSHNSKRLLVLLAINANDAVPVDAVVEAVWPVRRPADPIHALHTTVTGARRNVAPCRGSDRKAARIDHLGWAYRLSISNNEIDSYCFEHLVSTGRRLTTRGEPDAASAVLSDALALWRGPALGGLGDEHAFQAAAIRLENLRLAAHELLIDAGLMLGRHAELVGQLEALAAAHPTDEVICARLMVALYRSGRQVEALGCYRHLASTLAEVLGLDPTPDLQDLEQAILEHRPTLEDPRVVPVGVEHRHD